MTHDTDRDTRHNARMARKKDVVDDKIAAAQAERGVLLVNTGNGKGKSSAGFGLVARALGHGMQVFPAAAQFVQIAQRGQHRIGQHRQQQQRQRRQAQQQQAAGSAEGAEQHPPDASRAGQR